MRLDPVAADAAAVLPALRAMLAGGPALGLGADAAAEVPDGTAAVVTTSGSTGTPKAVVLSRAALVASARATNARIGEGTWLLTLPAGYVAGLQVLTRAVLAGSEPVVLHGSFRPDAFAAAARALPPGPAYTSLVPAQLHRLLDASDDPDVVAALRSFQTILVGGQALPAAALARTRELGARVVRTYGSSETCGGCVYDGVPLDGARMRVVDGEVQLSGPMLADGYLGAPAPTAAAFVRDEDGTRWYRTGDGGAIADGVLRVTGRLDNVIVSGGTNISLDRVERAVREVPGLAAAVVVGVPDERWGEASVVVVPRTDGVCASHLRLDAARRAVAEQVGPHARPALLQVVDRIPLLPSGKPDRAALARTVRGG